MITYNLKSSHLCIHCVIITTIEVINIFHLQKFFLCPFRFVLLLFLFFSGDGGGRYGELFNECEVSYAG